MIAFVIGTRPEIIKMSPLLRRARKEGIPHVFIHSNQHYSQEMDAQIISDLQLQAPDYNLGVGSATHAVQTGKIMERVEKIFQEVKPGYVIVHGDTNTTLAGALTAKKLQIPVAHIEAGLRSFDMGMPEEINRIMVDHISDLHFAPTELARDHLRKEGLSPDKIVVTGNTVQDALLEHIPLTAHTSILPDHGLTANNYVLATLHRAENVDLPSRLQAMIRQLELASHLTGHKVVWPMHPRTAAVLSAQNITLPGSILTLPPVGYIEMLALLQHCSLVLTDSGGVQEEAYILKRPLITLRNSTERPETLSANFIVDTNPELLEKAWNAFQNHEVSWDSSAFGKNTASDTIMQRLQHELAQKSTT